MSLTGNKLIHMNSSVAAAAPTAAQMTQGQFAINNTDQKVFIKDASNNIVAVASALAVTKALSAVQTVNGQSPDGSGAVTLLPSQIGSFGVAPLDSGSKIPVAFLPAAVLGNVDYIGSWDASTNTPTLPDPTTVKGHYYVTSVAGTQTGAGFDGGSLTFAIGDWAISNGVVWQKVTSESTITSVNGKTGVVVLSAADVGALALTGGSLSGTVTFTAGTVTGLPNPTNASDAANKAYVDAAVGSGGTVTSVNVVSNDTSVLTATGGPITSSGSVTLDFANQAINTVFAGPGTGSAAKPTFRALVAADIPAIDEGTYA